MIHLDTSFLVRALVRGSPQDGRLRDWLGVGETLAISTIGWAEFLCGPIDQEQVDLALRIVTERVPFVEEDAVMAARLFNESGRRRGSFTDCMIAAAAMQPGVSLATANPSDFRRFEAAGLTVVAA
jgi:predicted nucleic acid-binding protein